MPLTKRQKRRLFEVSKMIQSSISVKDDMEDIQLEYSQEIEQVVNQIAIARKETESVAAVESGSISLAQSKTLQNVSRARDRRKERARIKEAREYIPPPKEAQPEAPDWAKRLWKSIAKKCHPDRLSFQELTAIEIARRQIWFLEARSLFENRSWPKLIHIGVQIDEYVEGIPHKLQLDWLNNEYKSISDHITEVQNSLAWTWGTKWDNLDLRARIIIAILNHRNVLLPSKNEILEILVKLEKE